MKTYFANLPADDLIKEVDKRIEKYNRYCDSTGQTAFWRKAHDYYYGKHVAGGDNTSTQSVGEDSELTAYGVNHYRNLIKHAIALSCSQKPSYDYRAVNTDQRSLQQARIANSVIDSYLEEKRMGRYMKEAAEMALVFKVGYVYQTWNTSIGRAVAPKDVENEQGERFTKIEREGDVDLCSKLPWYVKFDPNLRDAKKRKWEIVIELENRFDLMAQYPQYAEQIDGVDSKEIERLTGLGMDLIYREQDGDEDLIAVVNFYHLPTPACPDGVYLRYVGRDVKLYAGGYQYGDKLPCQRIAAGEKFDSAEGYSDFLDVMVLQEVVNLLYSTKLTNQKAFGVQALWMPDGCELSSEQVGQGMVILRGGPVGSEPKPIQLTATPAEIFRSIDYVEKNMEKIAGINSVVRGDPEHSLKSGAALGRIQAMAIQYSSNFQASWAELQEDVGTFLIRTLKSFAKTDRVLAYAGRYNKGAIKSFSGKDLELIDRVICTLGNPMQRTFAGRTELAETFSQKGWLKGPEQYFELIQTGNIDPILEGPTSTAELIRKENERLTSGQPVSAMVGDKHLLHSSEHYTILNDPDLRTRAAEGDQLSIQILQNTLAHIKEHQSLHESQEPFFFAISGEAPPPPPAPPMMLPPDGMGPMPPPPMDEGVGVMPPPPPMMPPIPPM